MSHIFISYATPDRPHVDDLCAQLKRLAIPYWIAPASIKPGEIWPKAIDSAIQSCSVFLLVVSKSADESDPVANELEAASHHKKQIVPVRIDQFEPNNLAFYLRRRHWADWPLADEQLRAIAGTVPAPAPVQPTNNLAPKVNPKDGLTYVWIPPSGTIKGFWLSQTPVTQSAYQRVTGLKPSHFKGDQLPVESITYFDAEAYCKAVGGRLPTEAEWEYAARGGTASELYGELDKIAWHEGNSDGKTHPVAELHPNSFGLYDILGNVWEWMNDWYDRAQTIRALRGGSWDLLPGGVRVSTRNRNLPVNWEVSIGFRCVWEKPTF